jgi:hypothetical protein
MVDDARSEESGTSLIKQMQLLNDIFEFFETVRTVFEKPE